MRGRRADVRSDERGVRHDVWVENDEGKRDERSGVAEPGTRGEEDHEGQTPGEQSCGETHAEDEALAGAIVAREPVAAVEIGFGLKFAALKGRDPELLVQRGNGGEQLDQRRMLGIEAVVAGLPHHVSREHVIAFIPRERLAMDHDGDERCLDGEKDENRGCELFSGECHRTRGIYLAAYRNLDVPPLASRRISKFPRNCV